MIRVLIILMLILPFSGGCALFDPRPPVQPGHSGLVVTAENELANAVTVFEQVTEFDHQNLAYVKEHFPDAHAMVQHLRIHFWPAYDSTTAALRIYKRSRLPEDGQEVESQLVQIRDLVRQARLALLQAQGQPAPAATQPTPSPSS